MYKLYYKQGTCSLAINALLNFLEQKHELLDVTKVDGFDQISPTGAVPYLVDENNFSVQEGAAIALHLMEKHSTTLLPQNNPKQKSLNNQWMMFANATVHPTYSRAFFLLKNGKDEKLMKATTDRINELWKIADAKLAKTKFIAGVEISMGDIFLTVYANWNHFFGDVIQLGPNSTRMVKEVANRPAFQKALESERLKFTVK